MERISYVIVSGGRDFTNTELMHRTLCVVVGLLDMVTILHGDAKGADALARTWAEKYGVARQQFDADWTKHGLAAGPIRNAEMVRHGTHLVAFWDGQSKGTKDIIDKARARKLPVVDVPYGSKPRHENHGQLTYGCVLGPPAADLATRVQ